MMGNRNVKNQVRSVQRMDHFSMNELPYCSVQRLRRTGFSMLELLVVIGIIVALAAMLFSVLGRTMENARIKATRVTIMKINTILKQQRKEFEQAEVKNRTYPQKSTFGGFGEPTAEKLYAKKLRMKQAFPQRFEDLVGADGVAGQFDRNGSGFDEDITPPGPDGMADWETLNGVLRPDLEEFGQVMASGGTYSDDSTIGKLIANKISKGTFDKNKHDPATESAELLYLTITSSSFGVTTADDGEFSAKEIADTDGDGLMEFVDAWGNPLRFYRWPTRLIRPDGNVADGASTDTFWNLVSSVKLDQSTRETDPDDPTRKMYGVMINKAKISGQSPEYYFHEGDSDGDGTGDSNRLWSTFHTPYTYHTFLVISAGADGELGLLEPFNIGQFGHLARPTQATINNPSESPLVDNVTNLKLEEK